MYEKPLYPTPDGYRRSSKNPNKTKSLKQEVEELRALKARLVKETPPASQTVKSAESKTPSLNYFLQSPKKQTQISEKAAKLIASAIKSLLRSK